MNRLIALIAVVLICAFAVNLNAQTQRKNNKNTYKKANEKAQKAGAQQAKKAQKNAAKEAAAEEREAEKEEREVEREARRNGEEDGPSIIGGDTPAEDLPEPGEATDKEFKDKTLDAILDELEVVDPDKRDDFKKYARDAWEDSEKEDKRWAGVYRRYEDKPEKLGEETREHTEKLAKIWEDSDEDIVKKEVLTEEQMKRWKEASSDLRTKTNTDRYYEAKAKEQPVKEKKDESED